MINKLNFRLEKSTRRRDRRGFLVDFLKREELKGEDKQFGQIYFVTFEKPGVTRGNHYHKEKKEWFVVGQGKVLAILEDVKTKRRETLVLDGDDDVYERLFVGEGVAHALINLTPFAYVVNYCNKPYHEDDPDSHFYELVREAKKTRGQEKK